MRRITPSRATGPRVLVLRVDQWTLYQGLPDMAPLLIDAGVDPARPDLEWELDNRTMVVWFTVRRETDPRKLLERGRTA